MLIEGLIHGKLAEVQFVKRRSPNDITVAFKIPGEEKLDQCLLSKADEPRLSLAESNRPWSFDAPGDDFKLAVEAWRISLAYLFDPMMAIHASNVEPLPHQISAVYEAMLPRQPLRFLLADDPGAGKTVMAGLLIRELLMRADIRRVLIVAPGSLVAQWQDEMLEKFDLRFEMFSADLLESSASGNPFDDYDQVIARLDQLKLNDDFLAKLDRTRWDMVVIDEAHKLSVRAFGKKVEKSMRFKLAERLAKTTRHFLLMTATPHNGKDEDFQHFLSLLDTDRFYGKSRGNTKRLDTGDIMRRMVKEQLLNFDGTRLFQKRIAKTTQYTLSPLESQLYEAVTDYVKNEMHRAENLTDGTRKGNVGFALTSLQRRLASSPAAIYESIRRRKEKLKKLLDEEKQSNTQRVTMPVSLLIGDDDPWEADEDKPASDFEEMEEELVDTATAAQTVGQLEDEIAILDGLLIEARHVVESNVDRKWDELSKLLADPAMVDANGRRRKLIIFTEHRDTLQYLMRKIRAHLNSHDAVVRIDGSVSRDDRREIQERFWTDPETLILVATDAAGEGVNLQCANLMVNYDLPWNPNRIEQRFGRIHRIGQREVCHLWNMVAEGTREGEVFKCLLQKLERVRDALGDQVFDVLGEMFENISLKDMLIEAIRYGEDPLRKQELMERVEGLLDIQQIKDLISRNALCDVVMNREDLFRIKSDMEKAEARKLQPYFVRGFFEHAFTRLGGNLAPSENERLELTKVPATIIEKSKALDEKKRSPQVQKRYQRICFDKKFVRLEKPGAPVATLIHPGHPLMKTIIRMVGDEHRQKLRQGATFVAPLDMGSEPRVLVMFEHVIRESVEKREVSRRIQFVEIDAHGQARDAGWAPHLDLDPIEPSDRLLIEDILNSSWIGPALEDIAIRYATENIAPQHRDEVQARRELQVDKTLTAVNERLEREVNYYSERLLQLQEEMANGRDVRLAMDNVVNTIADLKARWNIRQSELLNMRHLQSAEPTLIGTALVIPAGLLSMRKGNKSPDADDRRRIERIAMQAVMNAERAQGREVVDVSAEKCGWDVTSIEPADDGKPAITRHIEVKGRAKGQDSITVTRNEILYALNQKEKFQLAIVMVDGDSYEGPIYVEDPFSDDISWAETSRSFNIDKLCSLNL